MTKNTSFRSHILALFNDRGFQSEAAQVQAKALLSEIAKPIPTFKWTYIARRVIRNIGMATFELESIARENPDKVDDLSAAGHKFALIWESLAQLREPLRRETALLNAAVNYELAGYQANAMCIAKQIGDGALEAEKPSLIDLSSIFLQRRFLQLAELSERTQAEPTSSSEANSSVIEAMALALAGNAFSQVLRFFLTGDEPALQKAIEVFNNAEKLYTSLALVEETNLVRSIRSLLLIMKRRSTWTLLSEYAPDVPRWDRYLKLLARGLGADVFRGRSISELWPSQIIAIKNELLPLTSNKIVRMPTSAGKTRIAEFAIVHTLIKNPDAKCIYVAPYRALVSELEQSFLNLFSDLGYRVSSITGTYESDDFEELLFRDTDLLVITPEKLDLLLRAKPEFLENVRLIVLDEAQIVHDKQRGIKFELLLTRLKRKLPDARFLTLSAVMPQETLEDFAMWFNALDAKDKLISFWRPSIQRYAKFEWSGETGIMRYVSEDIQLLKEFVPGVIKLQVFEYKNPTTGCINRRRFPEKTNKAQIAAELAFKFAERGPVLVFCSQTNFAEAVAKALQMRLELSKLTGEGVPPYFQGPERTRSSILAKEWLGNEHIVTSSLGSGVAVHHGKLPDIVRNAIETDFRQRNFRVLIATNTLAQGVNLPIRTVIVHSCWRYNDVTEIMNRISARDYWNIAGRAGRAGEETAGLIIHIKTKYQDEKDFKYYLEHRVNVEPVESALYQSLVGLVQERLSEEALKTELDPEILALLAEEGPISEEKVQEILGKSLVQIQANRTSYSMKKLNQIFVDVANSINEGISDPEIQATYSSTGLSTSSCQLIRNHIVENESLVRSLLLESGIDVLNDVIELLLSICLKLPEIQSQREFGGNYSDLLRQWIEGTEIEDLMAEFGEQAGSFEELGRFIDDLFRYRLPWGISGCIRIAIKILDIDQRALSEFARYLPSMVKFGIPNPVACWAMSMGIPSRRIAMEVATAYLNKATSPSSKNFREWLGTLTSDTLYYDFKLTSPLLEDVSRSISISSVNPLLRRFKTLTEFLPREVEVSGIRYKNRHVVALQAQLGQRVDLVRDYDNIIDRNAIRVDWSNQGMGYVPREVAQVLAPEMDTGTILNATITGIDESGSLPNITIRIVKG